MLSVGEVDVRELTRFGNQLAALGDAGPGVVSRALNRTGRMGYTAVIRAVARQTGLPQRRVRQNVYTRSATPGDLVFTVEAFGREVPLKEFKARETRAGVSVFIRGGREVFEGAFIRGGSFTRGRVDLDMGDHVFQRIGPRRVPIAKVASGVAIPLEVVSDESAEAWAATVETALPRRLSHEISRAMGL